MENKTQSLPLNLELKDIHVTDYPEDLTDFVVPILVTIGDKNDPRGGGESFYFTVASLQGLQHENSSGLGFRFLRGYILMDNFDMNLIRKAIENLVNHARARKTWGEVVSFFNRYGQYDSEDLNGKPTPS